MERHDGAGVNVVVSEGICDILVILTVETTSEVYVQSLQKAPLGEESTSALCN